MTKAELIQVLTYLSYAFEGKFHFPKESEEENDMFCSVWKEQLDHIKVQTVLKGAKRYVAAGNVWPPTPGKLRQEAEKVMKPLEETLSAEEAWAQLVRVAQVYGVYRVKEALSNLPPRTQKTVETMGGFFKVVTTDDPQNFLQKRFFDIYNSLSQSELERGSMFPEINRPPELEEKRKALMGKITGKGV